MKSLRIVWAASLLLLPSPAWAADEWATLGTISAEPTPGYVCYGNANGKDITCNSSAPYVDTATGNVGIGTTAPQRSLHIVGSGGQGVLRIDRETAAGGIYLNRLSSGVLQSGFVMSGFTDNFFIGFDEDSGGANTPIMWLTSSGNMGIGESMSSPSERLEVSGNVKASGTVQVAETGVCSSAADLGKLRYNSTVGRFQICRP